MKVIYRRCKHCGVVYQYQISGKCNNPNNNGEYCSKCQEAIFYALKKIPVKIKKEYSNCNDYTLDECKQFIRDIDSAIKKRRESGEIIGVRVFACLYDSTDLDNHHVVRQFFKDGKEYVVSYWTKKNDWSLTVAREYDCITETYGDYWREYE